MGVAASCTDRIFLFPVFSLVWHLGPGCLGSPAPPGVTPPLPCRETAFRMQTSKSTVLLGGALLQLVLLL